MYGKGISREGSVLDVGTELGIISRSGSWYSYNNERIGQGRENAKLFLMQNTKLIDEIEREIRKQLKFKLRESEEEKENQK